MKQNLDDKYFNCYNYLKGYYLDTDEPEPLFKLCYNTCETCTMKGDNINHNCETCKIKYSLGFNNSNNKLNCYENCSYYYYFDNSTNYHCTNDFICPDEYSKLQPIRRECIKNCSDEELTKMEFQNICYENCPNNTEQSLIKDN